MIAAAIAVAGLASLLLAAYGLNLLYLSFRALRLPRRPGPSVPPGGEPLVCVQLPIYNERYVAARVIDAACALDWPRDRLEVQVLDDSDDATVAVAAERAAHWRRRGVRVVHLRRGRRAGYKAGALAHGLSRTEAPLVAVFDADFVPPPDFLRRTVGAFADPRVGFVQARWGHLNETYSLFTRLQALMVDFHFLCEQAARPALGLPTNFTGTAGVWRRLAIEEAGGWSDRTLTEDLDLSYRAQLRGWRAVYLEEVVAPQELPVAVAAYRGQQLRWATGSFQTARHLLPALLRSDLRPVAKLEGAIHLLAYAAPILMLVEIATYPALLLASPGRLGLPGLASLALGVNLLSLAPVAGFAAAQARRGPAWWRRLPAVAAWSFVGAGTSLTVLAALFRAFRRHTFNRTPKYRIERPGQEWRDGDYVLAGDRFAPVELALGVAVLALAGAGAAQGRWLVTVYALLFGGGFLFLGGLALVQSLQVVALRALGRQAAAAALRAAGSGLLLVPAAALLAAVAGLGVAFEDSYHHWLVAATLATTGRLRDPLFGMEDSWLPAYHVLGAAVLRVAGTGSLWALRAANIALGLGALALTMRLAGSERRGRLAAALLVLNPAFLLTVTSAVAEPLQLALLLGCAAALDARRTPIAAVLAALACVAGTKSWLWVGAALAAQLAAGLLGARRRPALGWAVPALAVLALVQLGFAPAEHSIARASLEVASATARGSLAPGPLGRGGAFAGWFALAGLPMVALAPIGLFRAVRERSPSLVSLHAPSLGYLAVVIGLVAAGTYSGSDRYYLLALPSLAVLAAGALERLPAPAALGAAGAAALLTIGYVPVISGLAQENAGLLAAGAAAGRVPGRLLTDSPAAAYASGKPPADVLGSRDLPLDPGSATALLRARGFTSLVLDNIDYYRAARVFPDLAAGRPRAPFVPLGQPGSFTVPGGKPAAAYYLPIPGCSAPVGGAAWLCFDGAAGEGKTAGLARGAELAVGGRTVAGEGMGFGAPAAHFADGWVFPGTASTEVLGSGWRRVFELDRLELDDPQGRFTGYRAVPSRGRVVVDYRVAGDRVQVAASAQGLTGFDRLVLMNELSAAFDDLADAGGTRTGLAFGPWQETRGNWARLRAGSFGIEWMLAPVAGAELRAGRELDPARGLDWAGLDYVFGPGFQESEYEIKIGRAR